MKINIYGDGASIYGNERRCQRVCIYKREIREEEEIKLFGDGVPTYEMVGWCSEVIFLLSLYSPKGGVMVDVCWLLKGQG